MSRRVESIEAAIPEPIRRLAGRVLGSFWLTMTAVGILVIAMGWIRQSGVTAGMLGIIGASMVLLGVIGYAVYLVKYEL